MQYAHNVEAGGDAEAEPRRAAESARGAHAKGDAAACKRAEPDEWKADYETLLRAAQAEKDLCAHGTCTIVRVHVLLVRVFFQPIYYSTTRYEYEYTRINIECL